MIKVVFDVLSDHGLYFCVWVFWKYINIRQFDITLSSPLKPSFNTLYLRFFVEESILLESIESYEE